MTPYDKTRFKYLKHPFKGVENIAKNYSQSYQDMFVLTMLDGKHNGTYLEIGAFDPIFISNTYILEKDFGWTGVSIDIEDPIKADFERKRKNDFILSDALIVDYKKVFEQKNFPKQIDYLSIDIEPKTQTLECLKKLPLNEYRFSVITYETDYYDNSEGREVAEQVRKESRELLQSYGYELLVGNIANTGPTDVFEDWYVDPNVINRKILDTFKYNGDFNDSAEKFMLTKDGMVICNELYDGQGLGNQLWNYVVTRIIAQKRNATFSMLGRSKFKGSEFMELDFGKELIGGKSPEGGPAKVLPEGIRNYYAERRENLKDTNIDISRTDPTLLSLPLNTKFDGGCQSAKYLDGFRDDIRNWIRIKGEYKKYSMGENACVIHMRCGDFSGLKNVFLPETYYKNAMAYIKTLNPDVKFYCVTDQKEKAQSILPDVEIIGSALLNTEDTHKASHHLGGPIGIDFSYLINAPYLIIPNSSFSWWAAYLNPYATVVAPKYWAAHNISDGYWSTSDIITDEFIYIDREGKAFSSVECQKEKERYESNHADMFVSVKTKEKRSIWQWIKPRIAALWKKGR